MHPKLLKSRIICATFLSLFQLSNVLFCVQVDSVIVSLVSHLCLISALVFHSSIKNLLRLSNVIPDPVKHHSLNKLWSHNAKPLNIYTFHVQTYDVAFQYKHILARPFSSIMESGLSFTTTGFI